METDSKGRQIDPDSKLPIGSVIRNHKGEYGIVGYRSVIRVTKAEVDAITHGLKMEKPAQCMAIFAHDQGADHVLYCRYHEGHIGPHRTIYEPGDEWTDNSPNAKWAKEIAFRLGIRKN